MTALHASHRPPGIPAVLGFGLFVAFCAVVPLLLGLALGHAWMVAVGAVGTVAVVLAALSRPGRRALLDISPVHEEHRHRHR